MKHGVLLRSFIRVCDVLLNIPGYALTENRKTKRWNSSTFSDPGSRSVWWNISEQNKFFVYDFNFECIDDRPASSRVRRSGWIFSVIQVFKRFLISFVQTNRSFFSGLFVESLFNLCWCLLFQDINGTICLKQKGLPVLSESCWCHYNINSCWDKVMLSERRTAYCSGTECCFSELYC